MITRTHVFIFILRLTCLRAFLSQSAHRTAPWTNHHVATRMTSTSQENTIFVAMTREDGKNDKLAECINALGQGLTPVELPCIEHAHGPDFDRLPETLYSQPWDYVIVTSPESAKVLSSAWDPQRRDQAPPVAAVGVATQVALESYGIPVAFTPSIATAVVLAKELPVSDAGPTRILYPASVRAAQTLASGLEARGMLVTRLNTYDTVPAQWTPQQRETARQCQIACFASPSAVKSWLVNVQDSNIDAVVSRPLAACIGETSAKACREHGWNESEIFYPHAPGMEAWVEAVGQAAQKLSLQQLH